MAIQMRQGAYADFNPAKMRAGEWAVSTDNDTKKQVIWMCFKPGVVKQMGTVEDFDIQIQMLIQEYLDDIASSVSKAQNSANTATSKANEASNSAKSAQNSANAAKTYSDNVAQMSGKIDTAVSQANAATTKANEAAQKAEQQANLVEQKANGKGITFSVTSAGLLNVAQEG